MWWRRWVATQPMIEPCSAADPATARATFNRRFARKLWWANKRWKPTAMPKPVKRYKPTAKTTSPRLTTRPHPSGRNMASPTIGPHTRRAVTNRPAVGLGRGGGTSFAIDAVLSPPVANERGGTSMVLPSNGSPLALPRGSPPYANTAKVPKDHRGLGRHTTIHTYRWRMARQIVRSCSHDHKSAGVDCAPDPHRRND